MYQLFYNDEIVFTGTLDECQAEMHKAVCSMEQDGADMFSPGGSDLCSIDYHNRDILEIKPVLKHGGL